MESIYDIIPREGLGKEVLKKILPLWSFMGKVQSSRESPSILPVFLRASTTYISIGKTAMNLVGLRGGTYNREQLPLEELTDEEKKELKGVLEEIGII